MPRGANKKREREYNELKREFKKEGRYKGREQEVAARIVNKQRSRFGETKAEKRKDRQHKSPDRGLPIKNYQHKTVDQVERALGRLSPNEVREVERYEKKHKQRKTLLAAIRTELDGSKSQGRDGHAKSRSRDGASGRSKSSGRKSSKTKSKTTRSKKSGASSRSRRSKRSHDDSEGNVTTDHDEIRQWVEERGGHPATVRSTVGKHHQAGILRIDYPGYSGGDSLEKISWKEFFDKFEKAELAFLHQDETSGGKTSRFSKLIARS